MTTMLIKPEAPLQSWGDSSRFTERKTRPEPTKSGVLGLLAAAPGRRRTDPIEDLVELTFGVRTDQPGQLTRDFQTRNRLAHRKIQAVVASLLPRRRQVRRLWCGRQRFTGPGNRGGTAETPDVSVGSPSGVRAPPAGPMSTSISLAPLAQAPREAPWSASAGYREKQARSVTLIAWDALPRDSVDETIRDAPVSFDPTDRQYTWRNVVYDVVHIPNPQSGSKGYDRLGRAPGEADVYVTNRSQPATSGSDEASGPTASPGRLLTSSSVAPSQGRGLKHPANSSPVFGEVALSQGVD